MEEELLKTSWKQRLIILGVALLLLGSTVAVYVMIVLNGGTSVNYSKMTTDQLQTAYEEAYGEYESRGAELSVEYFEDFKTYKSRVKAFNSASANSDGIKTKDLKEGDGEDLTNDNYAAYYIGWCSDETIFDSSFDNADEPTALNAPLLIQPDSLIEGWYLGTEGMKLGGVREVTIPGSLAYGDSMEICGGTNSPLKFVIYTVPRDEKLVEIDEKLDKIYTALSAAYASSYSNYSDDYEESVPADE
ncbi:FKBP-type peptidyl-prolyl cis-trans isomerase [Candidatus Saccharibacteria bacterium]|nr:FKBP-type peptidyl-prolyl cis-trans isomerase [Candidatus Saccharibacteria bacterium]